MTLIVPCSANRSAPTLNEPANTDKIIIGISNQKYQKSNPDKRKEKCKRYYERLKANPERFQAFQAKQKCYKIKRKQTHQAEQL